MATKQELGRDGLLDEKSVAERAAREVESYVEAMEKKAEGASQQGAVPAPSADDTQVKPVVDDFGQIVMASARSKAPNITLPLTEEETRDGLHHKLFDAIKWAATLCVYMIKKYPGRVFYRNEK